MRRIIGCILLLFSFLSVYGQMQESAAYHPPLKLEPVVSGSFGELRSNHFHSGLDLTTNGKTGYRVYSSEDGYVSRINVSALGYGKAIYIDHPDGHTTVYGHLERYSDRIDSLVRRRQYATKSFTIELFFKAGELPVVKGEVIAFSGNSGSSGGPHLHYEVREAETQKPMDPLFFRNDVKDDVKPRIQGFKIYPLDEQARVEGANKDRYWEAVFYDKAFHPKGKTIIYGAGQLGVGVQVLDYFSDSWRKCGVRTIDLFVNDRCIYTSDVSSFSFAETRYINSHIDYSEKQRTGKVIQKSFIEPNNRLSIYKNVVNRGVIQLAAGDTLALKYVVKDFAGNESHMEFELRGRDYPEEKPAAGPEPTPLQTIAWNKAFTYEEHMVEIAFESRTFYTDIPFYFEIDRDDNDFLSPVYVIGNDEVPMHKSFNLTLPLPDSLYLPKDKLYVAGVTAKGQTYYIGGTVKGRQIQTSYRGFGKFTLAVDTVPPVIKLSKVPAGSNYKNSKEIEVLIQDDLSGIKSYNCYLDDQWALFEFDAKTNRLIGFINHLPVVREGSHRLKIIVEDNRGNQSLKEYTISL